MNFCQQHVNAMVTLFKEHMVAPPFLKLLHEHGSEMHAVFDEELTASMEMGECFRNAAMLAGDGFTYCEGFAMRRGLIPLEHAWVLDQNGNVIDPTWDGECEYFGVAFDYEFLMSHLISTKYYGIGPNLFLLRKTPEEVLALLKDGILE